MTSTEPVIAQQTKGLRPLVLLGGVALLLGVGIYAGLRSLASDATRVDATSASAAASEVAAESGATLDHMARAAALPVTITRLEERLARQPQDLAGLTLLARSYVQTGHLAEGIKAFRRALDLSPRDVSLMVELADALAFANHQRFDAESQSMLERALTLEPNHPGALSLAGLAAFDQADYELAARHWRRYLTVTPPEAQGQVKQGLAAAEERLKRVQMKEST